MIQSRLLLTTLLLLLPASSAPRQERVEFPKGKATVTMKGTLKGGNDVDYLLPVAQEQKVSITLQTGKASTCFNVMESGKDEALFIGSVSGEKFEGKLPAKDYVVRVYQMRSAARRGSASSYTITFQKGGK